MAIRWGANPYTVAMFQNSLAALDVHWILLYFGIMGACVYLWGAGGNDGGIGFDESDPD